MAGELRVPLIRLLDGNRRRRHGHVLVEFGRTTCRTIRLGRLWSPTSAGSPWWRWRSDGRGLGAARLVTSHVASWCGTPARCSWPGRRSSRPAWVSGWTRRRWGCSCGRERAGTVDMVAGTEARADELIRAVLGYLPSNAWHLPPRGPIEDDPNRLDGVVCGPGAAAPSRAVRHAAPAFVHPGQRQPARVFPPVRAERHHVAGPVWTAGRSRCWPATALLWRRDDRDGADKVARVRRPRRHVPPAGAASGRPAGFVIGGPQSGPVAIRRGARAIAAVVPEPGCRGPACSCAGVRRRRRGPPPTRPVLHRSAWRR